MQPVANKKRLLWVGDAVTQTGFARVTHNVLKHLHDSGEWEIAVLGVNYNGDPHRYPYRIFPAMIGGDVWGIGRVKAIAEGFRPDVILILQDPWNIAPYLDELKEVPVPAVAYMPVDAPNQLAGKQLYEMGLNRAITYTEFGRNELTLSGWLGRTSIIPHGVDTDLYAPMDREEAREKLQLTKKLAQNAFIFGNVNRNQPRKRLDLTIMYWAQWWVNQGQPSNAYLHLHCSNQDIGWNILQLATYFGINRQLIVTNPNMRPDLLLAEENMRALYAAQDVHISTTLGEGWGLTAHESMACGVPQILPDYAAFGEWCDGAVRFVPVTSHAVHLQGINTIGGIADMEIFMDEMTRMYKEPELREEYGRLALARATEDRFKWPNIAKQFHDVLVTASEENRRRPVGLKEARR